MSTGKYITVEGIDGSGTSSVVDSIDVDRYRKTHEPSMLWTGRATRSGFEKEDPDPRTMFHMFLADRHEHQAKIIEPTLDDGTHIISDRGPDSTRAYQAVAGIPVSEIENQLGKLREPDLTIWIDVDPEVAWDRTDKEDEYEKDLDFQKKVNSVYRDLWKQHDRIKRVDGNKRQLSVLFNAIGIIYNEL